jgi:hypothetical protein
MNLFQAVVIMLFWELLGVNLGHAGAGGVVGTGSGYFVITLPAA